MTNIFGLRASGLSRFVPLPVGKDPAAVFTLPPVATAKEEIYPDGMYRSTWMSYIESFKSAKLGTDQESFSHKGKLS